MLLLKLFHCFKLETDTPCFEAMPDNVSPLCTLYVELDPEVELELELLDPELESELPELELPAFPLIFNVLPA